MFFLTCFPLDSINNKLINLASIAHSNGWVFGWSAEESLLPWFFSMVTKSQAGGRQLKLCRCILTKQHNLKNRKGDSHD